MPKGTPTAGWIVDAPELGPVADPSPTPTVDDLLDGPYLSQLADFLGGDEPTVEEVTRTLISAEHLPRADALDDYKRLLVAELETEAAKIAALVEDELPDDREEIQRRLTLHRQIVEAVGVLTLQRLLIIFALTRVEESGVAEARATLALSESERDRLIQESRDKRESAEIALQVAARIE